MVFRDRHDAGRQLAARLEHLRDDRPVVLGLPRGGIVVAAEIAKALDAALDVLVVRKIGAPMQPELAIGAITDGGQPHLVVNEDVLRSVGATEEYLRAAAQSELAEVHRRQVLYRGDRAAVNVTDRVVIVVDDGIATGATLRAGLDALRRRNPKRLVLAVPVAPPQALSVFEPEVDELVCLHSPERFMAVGVFYENFAQTTDDEVIEAMQRHADDGR